MDNQTSLSILRRIEATRGDRPVKRAGDPVLPTISPAEALGRSASAGLKADALQDVLRYLTAGIGVGMAGRGAVGLWNLARRNLAGRPHTNPAPSVLPIPVPPAADPRRRRDEPVAKAATDSPVLDAARSFGSGDYASTKIGIPWYMPATLLGAVGGLGLGWGGLDLALDARRRGEIDSDLERSERDFRDALATQTGAKTAADGIEKTAGARLGEELDRLYDTFVEKSAWLGDTAGTLAGGYLTYAGVAAPLAGYAAWKAVRKRQRAELIAKALQRRKRERYAQQPPELLAVPAATGAELA
jgi:hypothetical protein